MAERTVTIPRRTADGPELKYASARMKFYVDVKRCIECGGCEVACKNANNVPAGIARIRVVTVNEGEPGETNVAVPCMQCSKAPCVAVCPVDALYHRPDGIVALNKETCIGCGYCLYACPFGAPQFPKASPFGARGVMDKCTYCAGGPEEPFSERERRLYGSNRIAEGKLPMCASVCATKALIAGDAEEVANVVRMRMAARGAGGGAWGWDAAYGPSR
jgi:formate dehydrogenase iron-sulfur subunit